MFNSPNKSIGVIKGLESAPGKNILINGNFTVNQYGSDLDAQYAFTAEDNYYTDRWVKRAGNRITQMVEDVNYEPNTEYTLSFYRQDGSRVSVTANSPASGHWDITTTHNQEALYFTDRKIQLEKGDTATDFEREDVGTTLAKCQRYYVDVGNRMLAGARTGMDLQFSHQSFPQPMRVVPVVTIRPSENQFLDDQYGGATGAVTEYQFGPPLFATATWRAQPDKVTTNGYQVTCASGWFKQEWNYFYGWSYKADAEIPA